MNGPEEQTSKPNQLVAVEGLGAGLASGQWTLEEATTRFSRTLLDIGCDAKVIADDLTTLMNDGHRVLKPGDPAIATIVKMTTRSIIYRNDFDSASLPSRTTKPGQITQQIASESTAADSSRLDIDRLAADSTESILWVGPEQQAWRDKMTVRSAELLKGLLSGMEEQGYSRATAKCHMRQEFEALLADLTSRTSYAAMGMLPYILSIQAKAGLLNVRSIGRIVRSFVMPH